MGDFKPKFVKHFAQIGQQMKDAFQAYSQQVKDGSFPEEIHTYAKSDCSDAFLAQLDAEY